MPSHVAPETPGSIHEGGELGYSLSHAYGAAFDNPDLIVACVIGDGEAETGPLAGSWHSDKFLNPASDGAVLPILHLNGYKIANPTVLARIPAEELESLLRGYGYTPYTSRATTPSWCTSSSPRPWTRSSPRSAPSSDRARRATGDLERRPGLADDRAAHPQGLDRAQGGGRPAGGGHLAGAPGAARRGPAEPGAPGASWRSGCAPTTPRSCSTPTARCVPELAALAPRGDRRMGANPHANGGLLLRDLRLPDFREYAVAVPAPGATTVGGDPGARRLAARRDAGQPVRTSGCSARTRPNPTGSTDVYEVTGKQLRGRRSCRSTSTWPRDGRVMEILSEHTCQGWLEGYLLTGRHGLFSCYEAFIHIVDSMFNQHAKWLKVTRGIALAAPGRLAELPAHLARLAAGPQRLLPPGPRLHRPRGEQEGRGHPGLPAAGREHAAVGGRPLPAQPGLRQRDRGGQAAAARTGWTWTTRSSTAPAAPGSGSGRRNDAPGAARRGAGLRRRRADPGGAGRRRRSSASTCPSCKVRVVNVVDLMRLQPETEHPHGMSDAEFDALFTTDQPVIFAYHGYPSLIHRLTYRRRRARQLPRPRLQGGGHHHHALRHGRAERPGPLPPGHGRDRPGARPVLLGRPRPPADGRQAHSARAYTREQGEDAPEVATGLARWPS